MKNLGVYVHIPFCVRKCNYCDFYSRAATETQKEEYVASLVREIARFDAKDWVVDTIFFGGGTPSLLTHRQLDSIFTAITDKFTINSNSEISIEVNPATVKDFQGLHKIGFNRISIGAQSSNNRELEILGRLHTWEEFVRTYSDARRVFDNINIDLMFGIPEQTLESWRGTLQRVKNLDPEHISAYSLQVEKGTPFAEMDLALPSEDEEREMADLTEEILGDYVHYEISNFAKEGLECCHNLKYWTRGEYVGFGASAHSFLENKRINSEGEEREISGREALAEHMFLGLRLLAGVKLNTCTFDEIIEKHVGFGTVEREGDWVRLTKRGREVSNVVLADFI